MITITDIAKKANVSISTVSLALNGDPRVKSSTQERILEIAKELHYHPTHAAKSLSSGRTWSISVINLANSPSLSSGFYSQFLHGVHTIAMKSQYSVSVSLIDNDNGSLVRMIDEHRTDGLIIMNPSHCIPILEIVTNRNIPHVLLGRIPNRDFVSVDNDNIQVGYDATITLLNEKRSRILFLSGPKNLTLSQDRLLGYRRAHEEMVCPVNEELHVSCDGSSHSALQLISEILKKESISFDGIVAMSDALAVGAMAAIRKQGISIPGEIGIVGVNNDDISEFMAPPLTTVDLNAYRLGENAAMLLMENIEQTKKKNPIEKKRTIVPHSIVCRGTTLGTKRKP